MGLFHPTIKNLNCSMSPPSLDHYWYQHFTFYHDKTIYLCLGDNPVSTCISYNTDRNSWKTHTIPGSRHKYFSSVVLRNTLYIIGGNIVGNFHIAAASTPLPLTETPIMTPVPNLSYEGTNQCVVKIDEDNLVVIGGGSYRLARATQYNTQTNTETKLPTLKRKRQNHACVAVEIDSKK